MGKVLIFVRVSTEAQELEEQKKEMIDFVKLHGYNDGDYIILEEKGASAIKLNDKYLNMVNVVKSYIDEGTIDCVAVWHINRLGRRDDVLIELKNLFIDNKIQLLVKNPSIQLLNPDGTLNSGAELAFSLFATLVKQDMAERKEKFRRTKKANAAKGKFNGGVNLRFGYRVNEDKFFVEDEVDGPIVRLIFELYSTGKYSSHKVAIELNSRGILTSAGKTISAWLVNGILRSECYYGAAIEEWNNRVYPAIISKDIFDACAAIRESNKVIERRKLDGDTNVNLAAKLIRCTECGNLYTSHTDQYSCCSHNPKETHYCPNNLRINKKVIDGLCWRVASAIHMDYLIDMSEDKLEEYNREIEIIDQKIATLLSKIDGIEAKKQRVVEAYIEGLINAQNKTIKLNKIQEEVSIYTRDLNALKEAKNRLYGLIESYTKKEDVEVFLNSMDSTDEGNKYDIVHQHIKGIRIERYQWGERKRPDAKDNAILIIITTILDKEHRFIYIPNSKKVDKKLYIWNGREWKADIL
jgi:DNA invertase Pin-like site-specific DNA recombinase